MTIDELLDKLEALVREGRIRGYRDGPHIGFASPKRRSFCAVTAVCAYETGRFYVEMRALSAADRLLMERDDGRTIMDCSDYDEEWPDEGRRAICARLLALVPDGGAM